MSTFNAISPDKLFRLIGTSACPTLVDVRDNSSRLVPSARPLRYDEVEHWGANLSSPIVTICEQGREKAAGAAAWLRQLGLDAEILEGGMAAWERAGLPVVDAAKLPPRDEHGRTRWVTRARPKVDRIACPWLIRRFVDPNAVFLFVAPSEVEGVSQQLDAAPFDFEGVFWSHRGEQCSFDTMVDELGLAGFDALQRMRVIVRGADTARPELAPQCAGLVAASLGLSRMFADDHQQLEAGMVLYDAFYRWCRDATDETHDWVSHVPKSKKLAPVG
jgi:rhodanese-related sulfurtransferase